jgi:hypothetical protein
MVLTGAFAGGAVTTALENKILVFIGLILSVCTLHQSATENFTGLRTYAFAWRTLTT